MLKSSALVFHFPGSSTQSQAQICTGLLVYGQSPKQNTVYDYFASFTIGLHLLTQQITNGLGAITTYSQHVLYIRSQESQLFDSRIKNARSRFLATSFAVHQPRSTATPSTFVSQPILLLYPIKLMDAAFLTRVFEIMHRTT